MSWNNAYRLGLGAGLVVLAYGATAQNHEAPLSAIDWLSQSVAAPVILPVPAPTATDEPPAALSAASPGVTVSLLDDPAVDPIGLIASRDSRLPATLWARSSEVRLVALLSATEVTHVPALQELLIEMLLVEADLPLGATTNGALLLARVDKLLDIGALDLTQQLLAEADPTSTPNLFRRWFDVSLLSGTETAACGTMQRQPGLAPTYPARIFCLARNGDWNAAALTLNSARSIDELSEEDERLLTFFLDPALAEEAAPLQAPTRLSPLVFRLREAIGEAMLTTRLPPAFAHADLRDTSAWRNRILAAERLVGNGAIQLEVLFDLYQLNRPSASGGVWERAALVQRFLNGLADNDTAAVAEALPSLWQMMISFEADVAFAEQFAPQLLAFDTAMTADLAEMALLSGDYDQIAADLPAELTPNHLAVAIDSGAVDATVAMTPLEIAIRAGLTDHPAPSTLAQGLADGQMGEILLTTLDLFQQGRRGDYTALSDALATLRAAGLDEVAQQAAMQLLVQEDR